MAVFAVVAGARTVIASGAAGWFEVAGAEARRWTVAGAVVCGACAICCNSVECLLAVVRNEEKMMERKWRCCVAVAERSR